MSNSRGNRTRRSPRRAALGGVAMGLAALGASVGATLAQGAPAAHHHHHKAAKVAVGSGLGSITVTATSSAINMPLYSHAGEDVEADIPYSLATLDTGGIGEAVCSVLWPGSTGAHGGDTLNLLGIKALPTNVAQLLNDPEVAVAQTGVGKTTVNNSHPGLTMTSTATGTHVASLAAAGGSGVPVIGAIIGSTSAKSTITLTGPKTVTVNSISTVHNISLAKVIKIGAVTSKTHVVTNGKTSHGTAKTTVAGVSIAGIHVTIDNKGLHIPNKTLPLLGNTASKLVNTALKGAGIQLGVTKTAKHTHKAHTIVSAGALELRLNNPSYKTQVNDTGTVVIIGGASIDADAAPAYVPKPIKSTMPPPVKTPHTQAPSGGGAPSGPTSSGGGPIPPPNPITSSGPAPTGPGPVLAANPLTLPKGLKVWWVVLALAGAGLFAFGMKRLPDQVLQTSGPTCRLEE